MPRGRAPRLGSRARSTGLLVSGPVDRGERPLLTGKTVVLRAFEREDLKLVHRWQNDEDVMRLARSSPDHAISREALEARYEKAIKGDDFAEREYIIQERSSEQPIGWASITIHRWNRRATSADIGLA